MLIAQILRSFEVREHRIEFEWKNRRDIVRFIGR
jgi:hypothetical protein